MSLKDSTSSYDYSMSDHSYTYEDEEEELDFYRDEEEQDNGLNYTILTKEQIFDEQKEQILRISDMFEVPSSTARQLLSYMKWNVDKLVEKYYGGEADSIFKNGGIANPHARNIERKMNLENMECSICLEDYPFSEMSSLPCDHYFCASCWSSYLEVKILSEGQGKLITCPFKGCTLLVDEMTIEKLIDNELALNRYKQLIADAYVLDNVNVRWCPGKGCERAVRVHLLKEKEVECECGANYCFSCGLEHHAPADCKMANNWMEKCEKDGTNTQWIANYTKECPKCNYKIVKEGGCQYIFCSNCNHKFCWICLGAFDHLNHACNKFKEEKNVKSERAELNKYAHFFSRYKIHEDSVNFEDRIKSIIAQEINRRMTEENANWIDLIYLEEAYQRLRKSRKMLKWSYVYGYYLPKYINRELFEFLQADLEAETEKLSQLLESKETVEKKKMMNATNLVKKRVDKLLEGLAEGDITGGNNDAGDLKYTSVEKYDGWIYNTK